MVPSEDPFLNSLAEWLFKAAVPRLGRRRGDGTAKINGELIKFCLRNYVHSAREVDLRLFHQSGADWFGKLDWVLRPKRNAIATYAVEIDSSNNSKSVEKLLKSRQLNYVPVWIRWCTEITMEIPEEIVLIDLTEDAVLAR
jgi:hypothetical protein